MAAKATAPSKIVASTFHLDEIDRIATDQNQKYSIKGKTVIKENNTTERVELCSVRHPFPSVYYFTGQRPEKPKLGEYEFTVIREEENDNECIVFRHPTQRPIEILTVTEMNVGEEGENDGSQEPFQQSSNKAKNSWGKTVKPTPPKREPLPRKTIDAYES